MKLYIAGPMQGIPNFNFPMFNRVAEAARNAGHEVFNPAARDIERHNGTDISADNPTGDIKIAVENHSFNLRDALGDDLRYICQRADGIVMLPGWEKSNGARAEHATAVALGLTIIYLQTEGATNAFIQ